MVLGGTKFVGRHFVETALAAGHEVTIVNRGQTNADLFPSLPKIHVDRLDEAAMQGAFDSSWDAVADMNGYVPRAIQIAMDALTGKAHHYLFVSTISVYDPLGQTTLDVNSPKLPVPPPEVETIDADTYGGLKVGCENKLDAWMGDVTIVRPGMVIGPYDHTDRFHHWVRKIATFPDVLVPERSSQPVQFIDGRDLAQFMLSKLESRETGAFNGVGPAKPMMLGDMLEEIVRAGSSPCQLIQTPADQLEKAPFMLPKDGSMDAMFRVSAPGVTLRPLADTISDVLLEI